MKGIRKANVAFDRFLDVLAYLASVMIGATMLLICIDVVLRYAFNRPIAWTVDASQFVLLFTVSLGMAWLLKEEGHVKLDVVLVRLRPRPQALINAISSALGAMTLMALTWYSLQVTVRQIERGVMTPGVIYIPQASLLIPLAIGLFLLFIQLVRRSYRYLKIWRQARNEIVERTIDWF